MERILELPWIWAFSVLWVAVMFRANLIFWIGRGIAAGTGRSRFASLLDSPMYALAQRLAARWGIIVVPLSFLTVGLQSFVQLSAGVSRMPLRRYLPALAVGGVIWAALYSTVGLALFHTWMKAGGGWALAALVAVIAVMIGTKRCMRARYTKRLETEEAKKTEVPQEAGEQKLASVGPDHNMDTLPDALDEQPVAS